MKNMFTEFIKNVPTGARVTLCFNGEFGGVSVINTVIDEIKINEHYQNCPNEKIGVQLIHKPKRKRTQYMTNLSYYTDLAIYEGWLDIDVKKMLYTTEEKGNVTIQKGKYLSFDPRNMTTVIDTINPKPVFTYNIKKIIPLTL